MKKFLNNLVGAIIIAVLLHGIGMLVAWIVGAATGEAQPSLLLLTIPNFFKVAAVVLFVVSLVYPYLKGKITLKRRWVGQLVLLVAMVAVGFVAYIKSKTDQFYEAIKEPSRGWYGAVHVADPHLGYAPNPGVQGYHTFQDSTFLPMKWNEEGFRVPVDAPLPGNDQSPLILFLGCSFTYGDAVPAEAAFAHQVADSLGYRYINAGVCGYGLAHMYLRGQELIEKYQPDYVVLQHSPWLIDRGVRQYAPSYHTVVTSPYLTLAEGQLQAHDPPFMPAVYRLPVDEYKYAERGYGDYLSFAWRVGYPIGFYEFFHQYWTAFRIKLGMAAAPNEGKDSEIERQAYAALVLAIEKQGGTPILLSLSNNKNKGPATRALAQAVGVSRVANADSVLTAALADSSEENYARAYQHWRVIDGVEQKIDGHPNARAHTLIAQSLIDTILDR